MATIETYNEYTLEQLTQNSVNILIETFADIDGVKTKIGDNKRISYSNSAYGRMKVQELLPESYRKAVFNVWGDTPTVTEPMYDLD